MISQSLALSASFSLSSCWRQGFQWPSLKAEISRVLEASHGGWGGKEFLSLMGILDWLWGGVCKGSLPALEFFTLTEVRAPKRCQLHLQGPKKMSVTHCLWWLDTHATNSHSHIITRAGMLVFVSVAADSVLGIFLLLWIALTDTPPSVLVPTTQCSCLNSCLFLFE